MSDFSFSRDYMSRNTEFNYDDESTIDKSSISEVKVFTYQDLESELTNKDNEQKIDIALTKANSIINDDIPDNINMESLIAVVNLAAKGTEPFLKIIGLTTNDNVIHFRLTNNNYVSFKILNKERFKLDISKFRKGKVPYYKETEMTEEVHAMIVKDMAINMEEALKLVIAIISEKYERSSNKKDNKGNPFIADKSQIGVSIILKDDKKDDKGVWLAYEVMHLGSHEDYKDRTISFRDINPKNAWEGTKETLLSTSIKYDNSKTPKLEQIEYDATANDVANEVSNTNDTKNVVDSFVSDVSNVSMPEEGKMITFKEQFSMVRKLNSDSNIVKFNKDKNYEYLVRWTLPNKKKTLKVICYVPINEETYQDGLQKYKKEMGSYKKDMSEDINDGGGKRKKSKTKREGRRKGRRRRKRSRKYHRNGKNRKRTRLNINRKLS